MTTQTARLYDIDTWLMMWWLNMGRFAHDDASRWAYLSNAIGFASR